ncbi:MAG: hypothetical protein WBA31_05980 [Candidatus Dormiibacterota bacterium]
MTAFLRWDLVHVRRRVRPSLLALVVAGIAVASVAPALAAQNFSSTLKPCSVLPAPDIAKVLGQSGKPQPLQQALTDACVFGGGRLKVAAHTALIDYAETGVSSTPIFGLPANLLVWDSTALQPALAGRAHVQFLVPLRSYYWELVGTESVSNGQLLSLAQDLYHALGGTIEATAKTAIDGEVNAITSLDMNLQGTFSDEVKQVAVEICSTNSSLDSAVSGGGTVSCANSARVESAATVLITPFVNKLAGYQLAFARALPPDVKGGQSATKAQLNSAAQTLARVFVTVQSIVPSGQPLVPFRERPSNSSGYWVPAAEGWISYTLGAIAEAEAYVQRQGTKIGSNPGAEASIKAGL